MNLDYLNSITEGDIRLSQNLMITFLHQTPILLQELKHSIKAGNIEEMQKIAHKLKPSVEAFGMKKTGETLNKIEFSPMLNSTIKKMANHITSDCDIAMAELEEILSSTFGKSYPDGKVPELNEVSIVIVEDDNFYGRLLYQFLESWKGVDVNWLTTGQEVLDNLKLDPDLVLLNYDLPDMNGIELVEKIRENKIDPKIIMVSGSESYKIKDTDLSLRIDAYIHKGYDVLSRLTSTIQEVLK